MTTTAAVEPAHLEAWRPRQDVATAWRPGRAPMVVVVPHPDDETLGVGGLIRQQCAMGVEVTVVAVTDGDAAYDPSGDAELAVRRAAEQNAALDRLGIAPRRRHRLHLPDSRVDRFEAEVADALCDAVGAAGPGAVLVAPGELDVHPDHEAVGRAAVRAADRLHCVLISYYFWMWHLRAPDEVAAQLVSYRLSPETIVHKAAALAEHRSQIDPWEGNAAVLAPATLEPATWPCEYFVVRTP